MTTFRTSRRFFVRLFLLAALALAPGMVQAAPSVVVTIRPLHSLAAMVMQGVGEPQLLIRTAASPHSYAMRPSDALMLSRADLVIWTGEAMETFLSHSLPGLAKGATVIAVTDYPDLTLLPPRPPAGGEPAAEDDADEHAHLPDPHLWLSTENAARLVLDIAGSLAVADPEHGAAYHDNAVKAAAAIRQLHGELAAELTPFRDRGYVAAHDAYQYFERDFGLNYGGAVTAHAGRPPSAKHLLALTRRIEDEKVHCLMTEPAYHPPLIEQLAKELHLTLVEGDPLGLTLTPGPDLYSGLMRHLAASFRSCLGS